MQPLLKLTSAAPHEMDTGGDAAVMPDSHLRQQFDATRMRSPDLT